MKTFDAHTSPSSSPAVRCVVRRLEGRSQHSLFWLLPQSDLAKRLPPRIADIYCLSSSWRHHLWRRRHHYSGQFGTMNALGIGHSRSWRDVIPFTNGALYSRTIKLLFPDCRIHHRGAVTAFVNSNFAHPAALIMQSCPSSSSLQRVRTLFCDLTACRSSDHGCCSAGHHRSTVTVGLGIFVPDNNGASSFTGVDAARITLTVTDTTNNNVTRRRRKFGWTLR